VPTAREIPAVVIGAGHSGLAISSCLRDRGVDHVVLERGEVANSWKKERWDSLRLLTPNWQSQLPGQRYSGDDPDGFMTVDQVVEFVERYACHVDAPIHTDTTVSGLRPSGGSYGVTTNQGPWLADTVVFASGACNIPSVPIVAAGVPPGVDQMTPDRYRSPDQLTAGGVMVVGASATGLQLAEEIHLSGRPVTLSVGEHVRMTRRYRGRDIQFWLDVIGRLDERWDEVEDLGRARNLPSPQLVGTPEHKTLDLNALTDIGVQLRGRLGAVRDGMAQFSGGLRNQCRLADLKMRRLLKMIDEWIDEAGFECEPGAPDQFDATRVDDELPLALDLASGEIRTIVWATGFHADYSWLELPLLDHKGRIRHDGGVVTEAPGLYLIGTTFLRRRKSSFIHGAKDDANDLSNHLKGYLDSRRG
jgi:putative flavoprotein involved in K+ transport